MKKLKRHPIYFFSLLFVILIAIQSFLLYNTVLLKQSEIKNRAKDILETAKKKYPFFEASDGEKNIYRVDRLRNHTDLETDLRAQFKLYNDSIKVDLKQFIEDQYKQTGLQLAYKREISSIFDGIKKKQTLSKPIVLFETKPEPINNYLLYESNWETSYSSTQNQKISEENNIREHILKNKSENYFVNLVSYYDVLNMNYIIFKELWSLFFVSLLLMILMLYLYFQSFKKYKTQKEQVQLLHETIDNISHEFNTPLATLKIASKQLRFSKSDETLDLMDRQVIRLENVLKPLSSEEISIVTFTETQLVDFLNDYKSLYPNIEWKINISIDGVFKLSEFEMHSILNNLIENSLKYGGTLIKIQISQFDNKLKIIVEDNGIGIAKKDQHKVFDRFYRVSTNNIHNVKGLGLGLFLVQNIVKKYDGIIQIKSNLNEGCKLEIIL